MSNEIVNMTRYVVYRKIDEVVKNPGTPYESAFANPYLRRKLLLRVLNNTVPHYVESAPRQEVELARAGQFPIALEEEKQIESVIRENILEILQEEDVIKYLCNPDLISPRREPSHWFG
jgi:hypothetical protein